jgi:hypothetical protein
VRHHHRSVVALLAAGVLPVVMHAQASGGTLRTQVFTDVSSMRIDVRVGDHGAVGQQVTGTLRAADGTTVWRGSLGTLAKVEGMAGVSTRVPLARVQPWSPSSPVRYDLLLEVGTLRDSVRIGFRRITTANGRVLLNGRPVFLKGNAINPPGRNIPDSLSRSPRFAREYLSFLKQQGINIVRLGTPNALWLDAADDVGMLVFQGNYGTPRGGSATRVPGNFAASVAWYRDTILAPQVNHPSVVIYALTNETADPEVHYQSDGAAAMVSYLGAVTDSVRAWDPTRLILANAGYGHGRSGDLCDMHRYWGWYYNSFLSFYTLRDASTCWRDGKVQPITLSEVVGNYTGADGRYNLVSDTKQPDSQLNWTGHAPDEEQGPRALAYQAWLTGQAVEITRRLRPQNQALAGVVPFTILFSNWHGITSVTDMGPKPVVEQLVRSFRPVLLSWEHFTPQRYSGDAWPVVAHVVNDADDGRAIVGATLVATLRDGTGRARFTTRLPWPVAAHYTASARSLTIPLPRDAEGSLTLEGVLVRGRDTLSRNHTTVRVFARKSPVSMSGRTLRLYDPSGRTRRALSALGVRTEPLRQLVGLDPQRDAVVVGSGSWDTLLTGDVGLLEAFTTRGGRVLVLDQRPDAFATHWLPGGVRPSITPLDHPYVMPGGRPWAQGMAINPERPAHPVFRGITRDDLFLWSDYTGWRETKAGLPAVYPVTRGYALTRPQELSRVAVLANYDHGLAGHALTEHFIGRGSVVLSAFDMVPRVGSEPVADRLLHNLVAYVAGNDTHDVHPLISGIIEWGNYGSEQGIVTGVNSGLLVNTVPTMPEAMRAANATTIDAEGFWLAGGESGGWNTRPAVQYVARGRRPYGPYEFTSGGSYKLLDAGSAEGEGRVWWRVPEGRTSLQTTVLNPTSTPLSLTLTVNARPVTTIVAPNDSSVVRVPFTGTTVAMHARGDRRLVLLRTESR